MTPLEGAPALALVPREPQPQPAPAQPPANAIHWPRRYAQIRTVATASCWSGAAVSLFAIAAAPYLGEVVYPILFLCWMFLLGCGGMVVFLTAMVSHGRADLRAMLAAVLALATTVALGGPAGRAGAEAFVSSHAVELDRGAAEWVAAWARSKAIPELPPGLYDLGLRNPVAMEGGVWFHTDSPFTPDLFYADPAMKRAGLARCGRVTPIGDRWYRFECRSAAEYD